MKGVHSIEAVDIGLEEVASAEFVTAFERAVQAGATDGRTLPSWRRLFHLEPLLAIGALRGQIEFAIQNGAVA